MKKIKRLQFMESLKESSCFEGDTLSVFVLDDKTNRKRIVSTVVRSKKTKAVFRNRIKRVVRAFFYALAYPYYKVIIVVQMNKISKNQYVTAEHFAEDFATLNVFLPLTLQSRLG